MRFIFGTVLFFAFCTGWSQKTKPMGYESVALDRLLHELERHFDVQYSYLDSIVAPYRLHVPQKDYALNDIHTVIEHQTALRIEPIDKRYFSVFRPDMPQPQWLDEILVETWLSKGIDRKANAVVVSPQKIEILPGVTDADVMLSLQQLPGVKSPNETATGLHVRGGTPDQNLVLWDGIRMYHPGHLFGMISGFNPNTKQTVKYISKATDAFYGERVAGTIDIQTRDKLTDKVAFEAGVNGLNADVCAQIPLIKQKLDLQLSARKSYTQWWPSPAFDALADKVFQHTELDRFDHRNRFGFEDYNVKINFKPFENTHIGLSGILIDNGLDYTTGNGAALRQQLDVRNWGYSIGWRQNYSKRFWHRAAWQFSAYRFDYFRTNSHGIDYETFEKRNRITDSGFSIDWHYDVSDRLQWTLGYQLSGNDVSHVFRAGNEGLSVDLDQNQAYGNVHTVFGQGSFSVNRWQFLAGLRSSRYDAANLSVEPRVLVQRKLGRSWVWQSSLERKSQRIGQVREGVANDLSLENYVWVLADGTRYPKQYAMQYTTGLLFKSKGWLVDADAYYKTINGITTQSFGFWQQQHALALRGDGTTKGFDWLLQKNGPDWRAWATYTYQDSQNRFSEVNGGRYFATSTSITHAVSISGFKKWGRFSATAGWFWHSGRPFSTLDTQGRVASFNVSRLPVYHRLDLSAQYLWRQTKKWQAKIGASVTNVYNRRSVISKEYERNFAGVSDLFDARYSMRDYFSLGVMPNVFLRVSL